MLSHPKLVVNPGAEKLGIKPEDLAEILTARGLKKA
jgi:hypothetical protein